MTTEEREPGLLEQWLIDEGLPPEKAKRDAETMRALWRRFRAAPLDTLRRMWRGGAS